jgi:hypothetical protein
MRFRGLAEATIVVFAAIVIACVFTYPYIFNFSNAGRLDTNDGRWSIWVVSWVAHALTTDPASLFRANIFHPHPNALAFSEANLIAGIVAIPAWLLTKNPYVAHNVVFLFSFALSFITTYYLVRYLARDRRVAVVAAIMFAYCPFAFVRQAHIQLLLIGFLPWCALAWHRFLDRTSIARAIELGLVMAATGLACAYYGIFAGGMIAFATIWFAVTRGRWKDLSYWLPVAAAAAVCIGVIAPFFLPYLEMQQTTGFQRPIGGQYSANLGAWLNSSAWAHRWWAPYLRAPSEGLFPGIMAIVLGVSGAMMIPRLKAGAMAPTGFSRDVAWFYVALALFTVWLTLGPDAGLYTFLYNIVPVFSFLRAPSRAGIVVTLCLVILAAPAMKALLNRKHATAAFAVLLVLAVGDLYRAPLRMREAPPIPAVYRALAGLPRGPVAEIPFWSDPETYHGHAQYMLASTYHWQPLINGYSDHIPQEFRELAPILHGFPSREAFVELRRRRARYVMIHLWLYGRRDRERLMERLTAYAPYLTLLAVDGELRLYEISGWPEAHP